MALVGPLYRRDAYSLEKIDDVKSITALAKQAGEAGGKLRLVWLDVKPSVKHTAQNQRFDTGHIIRATLDTFYETPHAGNELAFMDLVHLDDIMQFDNQLPPHPYKKCEAMAHRALFHKDHDLSLRCNKNLADLLNAPDIDFTIMSSIAAQFLSMPQDIYHPGYHRVMATVQAAPVEAAMSIHKAIEKIVYLAGSTASTVELLTAQVKHGALINGITSPAPGTAMYQPPTGPCIKSGPLKDLDSHYNLAGFSATQLSAGGKAVTNSPGWAATHAKGRKTARRKSKVYALMPQGISKRSANGDINEPVSRKVYDRYKSKTRVKKKLTGEKKLAAAVKARDKYRLKHPGSTHVHCPKTG